MGQDNTFEAYHSDEDLIRDASRDNLPRLSVYPSPDTRVVLGRGGKAKIEVDLEACLKDGVPVVRRRGGGCAVVLDPGNVIVSVVLPARGVVEIPAVFHSLSQWLIAGLEQTGINGVTKRGISDLALKEQKVGGSCLYRSKELLYYSATLLVDPDLDKVERYLKHPPREPDYRKGRKHREFMGRLTLSIGQRDARELALALRSHLLPGKAWLAVKKGLQTARGFE